MPEKSNVKIKVIDRDLTLLKLDEKFLKTMRKKSKSRSCFLCKLAFALHLK